jgi:hypothetical protein
VFEMIAKVVRSVTSDDLIGISHELTRRMRQHKPIDPLNPIPQCEPSDLSDELIIIVSKIQSEIESKYQTPIGQISDDAESEIRVFLSDMNMKRFQSSPDYDPKRAEKLVEELIHTVPDHAGVRYGKVDIIDGKFVTVEYKDGEDEGYLRYKWEVIDFPKKPLKIRIEFSSDEVLALIPKHGFVATGNTPEEAKTNLLNSMEADYSHLKNQRYLLGEKLLSKLEFLEKLF